MEVKILQKFHDREDFTKVYPVGETVIFDDLRAEYLMGLGLVEKVVDEIVEAPVEEAIEEAIQAEAEEIAEAVEAPVEETPIKPVATSRRSSKNN